MLKRSRQSGAPREFAVKRFDAATKLSGVPSRLLRPHKEKWRDCELHSKRNSVHASWQRRMPEQLTTSCAKSVWRLLNFVTRFRSCVLKAMPQSSSLLDSKERNRRRLLVWKPGDVRPKDEVPRRI